MELRADPAQRPVRLGSEQQHGQRGAEVQRPGGQAETDADGDQRDREGRDQLQRHRRRERQPQRLDGGPPVAVGDRPDRRRPAPGPPVRDQGRAARGPRRGSARPGPPAAATAGAARSRVDEPDEGGEHRHQRQGARARSAPLTQSEPDDRGHGRDGQHAARTRAGR